MNTPGTTCWTLIRGAAAGDDRERAEFVRRYEALVTSFFAARWRIGASVADVHDAAQTVFVECFKRDGALATASANRPYEFRGFLYGVVRNVALRFERRDARRRDVARGADLDVDAFGATGRTLEQLFDRAWAEAFVGEAAQLHEDMARSRGPKALRRVELLRLRFEEGLPVREIAARWGVDARPLHRQYEKARAEFERCLWRVARHHDPDHPDGARRLLDDVLDILGAGRDRS